MRSSIARAGLHLVLCLLVLVGTMSAQNVRPAADGDLSLLVIPQSTGLQGAQSLLMKVEVTNIGKEPILVRADDLCLNPGSGLSMSVRDSSGHPVKTTVPLTCVPTADATERNGFVQLAPDAFYGRLIRIEASRIAQKSGRYELTFTLKGTMSRREVGQVIGATQAPIIAFTSNSSPLVFKFPIQLAK